MSLTDHPRMNDNSSLTILRPRAPSGTPLQIFGCVAAGLFVGVLIGLFLRTCCRPCLENWGYVFRGVLDERRGRVGMRERNSDGDGEGG